jgi:glycerophosphoryl diester phosphodiesterase
MRGFLPSSQPPLVFAHRGLAGPGVLPNTLPAFEAAALAKADAIECDVRLATDGSLFVFHNRSVVVDGLEVSVDELDAAARASFCMPDLAAVLALQTKWPASGLVLDIKTRAAGQALIERMRPDPHILLISFSDAVVSLACSRGFNAGLIDGFLPMLLRDLTPPNSYLCPSADRFTSYVDELTDGELAIADVGTVNDLELVAPLVRRGVWALTTDRCDEVTAVLRDLGVR